MLPVLLIAYLNVEGLRARIRELNTLDISEIFVFLDGFSPEAYPHLKSHRDELELFVNDSLLLGNISNLLRADHNLGVGIAVPRALDWFFSKVEIGLVLEDDCKLLSSSKAILEASSKVLDRFPNSVLCLSLPGEGDLDIESSDVLSFASSSFFSSWGWITKREVWMKNRVRNINLADVWRAVGSIPRISKFQKLMLTLSWSDIWFSLRKNQDRLWAFRYTILLINNSIAVIYPSQKCVQHEPTGFGTNVQSQPKWDKVQDSFVLSDGVDREIAIKPNDELERYILQKVHGSTISSLLSRKIVWAMKKLRLK
jgi:hypothetical protein